MSGWPSRISIDLPAPAMPEESLASDLAAARSAQARGSGSKSRMSLSRLPKELSARQCAASEVGGCSDGVTEMWERVKDKHRHRAEGRLTPGQARCRSRQALEERVPVSTTGRRTAAAADIVKPAKAPDQIVRRARKPARHPDPGHRTGTSPAGCGPGPRAPRTIETTHSGCCDIELRASERLPVELHPRVLIPFRSASVFRVLVREPRVAGSSKSLDGGPRPFVFNRAGSGFERDRFGCRRQVLVKPRCSFVSFWPSPWQSIWTSASPSLQNGAGRDFPAIVQVRDEQAAIERLISYERLARDWGNCKTKQWATLPAQLDAGRWACDSPRPRSPSRPWAIEAGARTRSAAATRNFRCRAEAAASRNCLSYQRAYDDAWTAGSTPAISRSSLTECRRRSRHVRRPAGLAGLRQETTAAREPAREAVVRQLGETACSILHGLGSPPWTHCAPSGSGRPGRAYRAATCAHGPITF